MATSVIYKDENNRVINEDPRGLLTEYTVITLENDIVKKSEWFAKRHNKEFRTVEYYLDPSENKTEIIQSYLNNKIGLTIYFNDQKRNGFTFWEAEGYSPTGILKRKDFIVYNEKHWVVMDCSFNPTTNKMWGPAYKYFYGNKKSNQYDDLLFLFHYRADGTLQDIADYNDNYDFNQGPEDLESFLSIMEYWDKDFHWEQHPYFHSLTPYLPETKNL